MQLPSRLAFLIGGASLLLAALGPMLAAQTVPTRGADVLGRMRADFSNKQYAAVIATGNGLLESPRALSTDERVAVWQLLAASYYPASADQQQPDSAQLPLAALIRLVPDIRIAKELSWPGLDSLTERMRGESFSVATRPLAEYVLRAATPAHLTVVASRPTRFRLSSRGADSLTVIHDSSAFVTVAALQIRSHVARRPVFSNGVHALDLWAFDSLSGDSVRVTHRVIALRADLPPAATPPPASLQPASLQPASPPPARPAMPDRAVRPARNRAMLWSGLALAAVTAAVAQEARPDDGIAAAFRVDPRAFAVGAAMATAAVTNFYARATPTRGPTRGETRGVTRGVTRGASPVGAALAEDRYRVRLQIDPPER